MRAVRAAATAVAETAVAAAIVAAAMAAAIAVMTVAAVVVAMRARDTAIRDARDVAAVVAPAPGLLALGRDVAEHEEKQDDCAENADQNGGRMHGREGE